MKNQSSKTRRIATEEDKLRAIRLLYNRLHRGFTLYLWIDRVYPLLAEHPRAQRTRVEILSVKNACVESTLMSVRDIDDFFRPRTDRSRDNDLHATDFYGFRCPGPFLSAKERDSINRWIAHLTYSPIWEGTSGLETEPTKNWDSADLVERAAHAVFGFIDHVEREISRRHVKEADEFRKVRAAFEQGLEELKARAAIEKQSSAPAADS
jgi:hypothetical protein